MAKLNPKRGGLTDCADSDCLFSTESEEAAN